MQRYSFEAICREERAVHEALFEEGTLPELEAIAGWQYQGWNLSFVAGLIGIRRFTKGLQTPAPGAPETDGYNLWIRQTGQPEDRWVPSSPKRHGFYKVRPSAQCGAADNVHPHAMFLDYGRGGNPWHQPSRFLRDYLVQVNADDPTLLIGKAYVALGAKRIFGGNFVMRRSADKSDDRRLR